MQEQFEKFKETFKEEFASLSLEELKDLFATELAKRDKLISELQEQNKLLLQSAFKEKMNRLEEKKF